MNSFQQLQRRDRSSSTESPRPQHRSLVPPRAAAVTHEPALPSSRRASHVVLAADAHGPGAIEIG
ncbi:MAG: hypothetical protein U9N48_00920 [Euryarchaeota archaeon]|nr:hypothetical protein [Euryarchaeota archaeon]